MHLHQSSKLSGIIIIGVTNGPRSACGGAGNPAVGEERLKASPGHKIGVGQSEEQAVRASEVQGGVIPAPIQESDGRGQGNPTPQPPPLIPRGGPPR
jgi:hypothetical protein